jgi:Holliday junction resolvasome RuvABC endonuclease subunit
MTPLLAIDPGATTGWAARDEAGTIHFGSWRLPGGAGMRINTLSWRLGAAMARFLPTLVVYEQPFLGDDVAISARPLIHYEGCILAHCDRHKVEAIPQDSALAKKAFGRAGLGKDDMVRVAAMMGHAVDCHDEADALGHLYWRMGILSQGALGIPAPKRRRKARC